MKKINGFLSIILVAVIAIVLSDCNKNSGQETLLDNGKYIKGFTKFVVTQPQITYPVTGSNGDNILSLEKTTFHSKIANSLATGSLDGTALKIKITTLNTDTTIITPSDSTTGSMAITKPSWYILMSPVLNWSVSDFDMSNHIQLFTAIDSDKSCDLQIILDKGTYLIEYFETGSIDPTKAKTITVN
jgi:hypothetical protein